MSTTPRLEKEAGVEETKQAAGGPAEPTGKPSKKERDAMKYDEKLAARGLKLVRFVVPLKLWDRFIAERCRERGPNVLFIDWLREQVGEK